MPFFAFAETFRFPLPQKVTVEPLFTLTAAPSKASATVVSVEVSLAGSSLSARVEVPSKWILTVADFFTTIGAVEEEASVRSSRMSVTPLSPLLTIIAPSEQLPVMR